MVPGPVWPVGKWPWALCVDEHQSAQPSGPSIAKQVHAQSIHKTDRVVPVLCSHLSTCPKPSISVSNTDIVDLYMVRPITQHVPNATPFIHPVHLRTNTGNIDTGSTTMMGLFDSGAMINAVSRTAFERAIPQLGSMLRSYRMLRMANGNLTPSAGRWIGHIQVAAHTVVAEFEIFDHSSGWEVLIGKGLLAQIGAVQDYQADTVLLTPTGDVLTNHNIIGTPKPSTQPATSAVVQIQQPQGRLGRTARHRQRQQRQLAAGLADHQDPPRQAMETPLVAAMEYAGDRFHPDRIRRILDLVRIGEDLTGHQRQQVTDLIREFADCFALSVDEVRLIPGAQHKIIIPEGATFPKRAPYSKILSDQQRQYLHSTINEWLLAGIVQRLRPEEVKCCSPITLAPKEHSSTGTSLEELRRLVNQQCAEANQPLAFPAETQEPKTRNGPIGDSHDRKWRICINYAAINKVTEVFPFPQGDIRAKQQRLSGHRWVCQLDFASGFYAVEVPETVRPYLAYFIEGIGYIAPVRMPFGATGAPASFNHVMAENLADVATSIGMELFVDDAGLAGSDFDTLLNRLRVFLQRARERTMSIAPAKTTLFADQVVFAGSRIGSQGVQPDPEKVDAVVRWEQPPDLLNLSSFLGLTGYFRDLIPGYANTARPLTDLLRRAGLNKTMGKQAYRNALKNFKLTASRWGPEEVRAFLALKIALTSDPVLRAPIFDGTPFIVTTDGCKDGFGGTLAQEMDTTLPSGKRIRKRHPIVFTFKHTSPSEEKYPPFLLEFAALKYALDQFSDIIWGSPIEIETDCQALRDVIMNPHLNVTHARWQDCILAHNIIAARHIPGTTNTASDALSRAGEGEPRREGDGSETTVAPDWDLGIIRKSTGSDKTATQRREGNGADGYNIQIRDVNGIELHNTDTTTQATAEELAQLQVRFQNERTFAEAVEAISALQNPQLEEKDRARRQHRADGYWIEGGRLWTRCRAPGRTFIRRECITKEEAKSMAEGTHQQLHMGRDIIKAQLAIQISCPGLDDIITKAIRACGQCSNFGPAHLHTKLEPITRRRPFELLVGDYLSMPPGKGGFTKIALFADVFSRHLFAFKCKSATGAFTVTCLKKIAQAYVPSIAFMSDGGSHFKCAEVRDACIAMGTKHIVAPPYSPWVNGLLEGSNKILLSVLKRRCAPNQLDHSDEGGRPQDWTIHLDDTIAELNSRILPTLLKTPKELLLSLTFPTAVDTPEPDQWDGPTVEEAVVNAALSELAILDGYEATLTHASRRKANFDRQLANKHPGEVDFHPGSLVQIHRTDLDRTVANERKMTPRWSTPHRIVSRIRNSYKLEDLDGNPLDMPFHARRLRRFQPPVVANEELKDSAVAVSRGGGPGPGGPEGLQNEERSREEVEGRDDEIGTAVEIGRQRK